MVSLVDLIFAVVSLGGQLYLRSIGKVILKQDYAALKEKDEEI